MEDYGYPPQFPAPIEEEEEKEEKTAIPTDPTKRPKKVIPNREGFK